MRSFLGFPREVYRSDSHWVPPLLLQTLLQLGAPGDSKKQLLLAFEGSKVVARIGVKVHGEVLHFGFFECLEGYPEAVKMLVSEAHCLAPNLPMRGPYNFRMEDPYTGLLVEGFESPPSFWSAYNPPYYVDYLEAAGLGKLIDLYTYRCDWESVNLAPVERRAQRAADRGIEVRLLDRSSRKADISEVASVMNDALKDNWGFEPFDEQQIKELTLLSYLFLDPNWLFLATHEERTVGCCIVLPDYNPWIKASGGRLTPWLLYKLLFCKKELKSIRAWALGVLEPYRRLFAAPALIGACVDQSREFGVQVAEIAWILENNKAMNAMLGTIGAQRSRVYRILERG